MASVSIQKGTVFKEIFDVLGFSSLSVQAQSYRNVNYNVPNTAIEKKVFKEIKKLPYYGVFDHIAFKVEGDTVTLYGKVVRGITSKQAETFVKDIAGVRNVVNNGKPPAPLTC